MEEQVIQETPVVTPDQPVAGADTAQQPDQSTQLRAEYESQIANLKAQATEAEEKFQGIKNKLDEVYKKQDDQRKKTLEDQGQWKDLWEEANRTAQEKDQQIGDLQRQLEELRTSNETAAMKTSALSAISQAGAINAEQMLMLMQNNLRKNDGGNVVVLNGGVEQDITTYLSNLKNPGSGFEHHFKPSSAAGMGAKPTPTSAIAPGMPNPWKEGSINLTRQMALEASDPDLAAVLKREAGR
jgi:predicted RNase H-like nuclease (RuvC/YqgF family)